MFTTKFSIGRTRRHRRQKGFTLVEVLIALVIMTIGMLGIAALYVEGLRSSRTAIFRTTAVNLAADMMDRIRANPAATAAYAGGGALSNCVNGNNDCLPAELAQHDIQLWEDRIAAQMPAGAAGDVVFVAGVPVDTYVIQIQWPEAGYDQDLTYTLAARL